MFASMRRMLRNDTQFCRIIFNFQEFQNRFNYAFIPNLLCCKELEDKFALGKDFADFVIGLLTGGFMI